MTVSLDCLDQHLDPSFVSPNTFEINVYFDQPYQLYTPYCVSPPMLVILIQIPQNDINDDELPQILR